MCLCVLVLSGTSICNPLTTRVKHARARSTKHSRGTRDQTHTHNGWVYEQCVAHASVRACPPRCASRRRLSLQRARANSLTRKHARARLKVVWTKGGSITRLPGGSAINLQPECQTWWERSPCQEGATQWITTLLPCHGLRNSMGRSGSEGRPYPSPTHHRQDARDDTGRGERRWLGQWGDATPPCERACARCHCRCKTRPPTSPCVVHGVKSVRAPQPSHRVNGGVQRQSFPYKPGQAGGVLRHELRAPHSLLRGEELLREHLDRAGASSSRERANTYNSIRPERAQARCPFNVGQRAQARSTLPHVCGTPCVKAGALFVGPSVRPLHHP